MAKHNDRLTIMIEKGRQRMVASAPISGIDKFVFIINRQFTNAPNTTQISSGAGRSSAAGSNAAIRSPHTRQQQSVGAGGTAKNKGGSERRFTYAAPRGRTKRTGKEAVIVINDQIVKLPRGRRNASATQVASGAGTYSIGGTNAAIESPGTKQQQTVGAGGTASNKWGKKRTRKR